MTTKVVSRNEKGQIHSFNDQPAQLKYDSQGRVVVQYWFRNGVWHRDNGKPAIITFYPDGKVEYMVWYKDGEKFCYDDKPSQIMLYEDGRVKHQKWIVGKRLHRHNWPAYVKYNSNGKMKEVKWFEDGNFIREETKTTIRNAVTW